MQTIDIDTWKRKEHFNFFHGSDYPQYNICANIDATHFLSFVKTQRISFYYAMIYASMRVANQIVAFRYRIRDHQVVLHDIIHPSFTDLNEGEDDLFKIVTVAMKDDLFEFVAYCKEESLGQKEYFRFQEFAGRDDFIYITCIPWISFTQLSHTMSFNKNESVPRLSWGKYFRENNKVLLPFSVQVNHALVDGLQVGEYFASLQSYIDHL